MDKILKEIKKLEIEKEEAIKNIEYEMAAQIRDRIRTLKEKLEK